MSKYIGTPVVSLSTDTVDVTGDITTTDATPEVIIVNDTHEDTDGGREGKLTFKGQASGGEETTLAQIQASHDGTSDDEKGDLIFKTNDGSDGASPTEAMRIESDQQVLITTSADAKGLTIKNTGNNRPYLNLDANRSGAGNNLAQMNFKWNGTDVARIIAVAGADTTNKDDAHITFGTASAGSVDERMRIDSGGNVGIGVSPSQKLHIEGAGNQFILLNNSTTNDGFFFKAGAGASSIQTNSGSNVMNFFTSGAERMRISSNGSKDFGQNTSGSAGYNMRSGAASTSDFAARFDGVGTGGSLAVQFVNGFGQVGSISLSGAATAYNTSSDYRLKENISNVTDGITRLKQLKPKRFSWIGEEKNEATLDGFLAHEAEEVVPEAITGTKDAMTEEVLYVDGDEIPQGKKVGDVKTASTINPQGIDQAKIVPLLTAALQEAIAKIETLETKVAALETE